METVLQVQSGVYPFLGAMRGKEVRVEEEQEFLRASDLIEKKAEMLKKRQIITSHYIIKLLKVYQAETSLRYIYQYVPLSLKDYIAQRCRQNEEGLQASKNSFLKKLSCELIMLISQMARMRVDLELSAETIGLTEDEKVKIFMPARCRMGNKTQIALLSLYRANKEKILHFCQQEFTRHLKNDESSANFTIKGNKLLFGSTLDQSIYLGANEPTEYEEDSSTYTSNVFSSSKLNQSTASCIHPQPYLRYTQSPNFRSKMNFNSDSESYHKVFSARNGHSSSQQKNSFKSRMDKPAFQYEDNSDARSYTHSKSIKIEFEQKVDPFKKKQRKDSVKVKVTTFHEYQLQDCDPSQFFTGGKAGNIPFDIQKHFKTEQSDDNNSESSFFNPNSTNRFSRRESTHSNTPAASTRQKDLEEKVRMAKEKAENLLSRFMACKKKISNH